MAHRKFSPTERLGVNAVERIITSEIKWIWREQTVIDFGIDGQIEIVADDGKPTGQLIAVQVKSGKSYFIGTRKDTPFYVDDAHLKYWDAHSLPVIIILYNPESDEMIWQWADANTARATSKGWRIDVPSEQVLNESSKTALLDQTWSDDSLGIRRRFALDYAFMKKFNDVDAFITIDKWVNKSLQYRSIEIRFEDPDKDCPDYEMPVMVTWHYEVDDLMNHFFPWLDYEYDREPDDWSGEVEEHLFVVELTRPARAFLEVEIYFEHVGDFEQNDGRSPGR